VNINENKETEYNEPLSRQEGEPMRELDPDYEEWLLDNDHLDAEAAAGLVNGRWHQARNRVLARRRICVWEGCTAPRKPGSKSQYCTTHRKAARQKWLEIIINNSKGRRPN